MKKIWSRGITLNVKVRCAFGHRGRFRLEAGDFCRILRRPDEVCMVICSAGECGWSLANSLGSRVFLDLFVRYWTTLSSGLATGHRLRCCLQGAARGFLRHNGPYQTEDEVDLSGPPWATAAAACVRDGQVFCAWVGSDEIFLHVGLQVWGASLPPAGKRGLPYVNRSVTFDREFEIKQAQWVMPFQGTVTLSSYQFPTRLPLALILELLDLKTEAQGTRWCEAENRFYFCVLSLSQ